MSFVKLKNKIKIGTYHIGEMIISYGDRISYNQTFGTSDLLQIIPERYRHHFVVLSMNVVNNVPPHTDSYITCAINFYIKTGGYRTFFYNIKNENIESTFQIKNQTNGKIFNKDNLILTDSFYAKKGEVFLLDVTKPHAVEAKFPKHRFALSIQTSKFSFNDVKEMLKETDQI
jgi:hypothetical protein